MNIKDKQKQKTDYLKALTFLLVSLFSVPLAAQSFITTWVTDDTEITIPTSSASYAYNYDITWTNLTNAGIGDGSISGQTGNYTITGLTNGDTYQIEISGVFPHLNMFFHPDANKLMSIEQWGDIEWASMSYAFSGCSHFLYHATDTPDLTNVTDMSSMFSMASSFNGAIDNWDVSGVTDMSNMFNSATSFNQDLNSWNVGNVTSMNSMFIGASSFNGEIGNWNVSNVENMSFMFQFASSFDQDISAWDVSSVLYMEAMFRNASSFNNGGVALSWTTGTGTSKVIITANMFENASNFNQSINSWDMGSVTIMSSMFLNASAYNQDMSNWDVSQVTNMREMFQNATSFDQDISDWDVSKSIDMIRMFSGASNYNNGGVALDWSSTTSLTSIGGMFTGASSFNQDVSSWDISNVTALNDLFENATSFNNGGVPLTWSAGTGTSNVTNMRDMFYGASSFNQDISSWDVGKATSMQQLFRQATSFDQSLADWDISSVTTMIDMLDETNLSPSNYDATLIGWNTLSAGESKIPTGINLGADALYYTSFGESSRNNLISTYGWSISGDELVVSLPEIAVYDGADNTAPPLSDAQVDIIDFGTEVLSSDITRIFSIQNTGTLDLTISSISVDDASFSINSSISSLAAGATETFTITLSGASIGSFSGEVSISSNDTDENPFTFSVSGEIVELSSPEIDLFAGIDNTAPSITSGQTAAIDFGRVLQGSDLAQTFAIENTGTADLAIIDITSSDASFTISSSISNIAPGATESFIITLSGATAGSFSSEIAISNDDADEGTFVFFVEGQIDESVPGITINQTLTSSPSPELTGTIDDPDATIEVFVNGFRYAATNNGDGTWILEEGSIAPDLKEGTYDVVARATSLEGLVGEDSSTNELEIRFDSVLSTDKNVTRWMVYPNPSDGNVILQGLLSRNEEVKLEIIERSGKVLKTLNIRETGWDARLNLMGLPNGIYVLRVISSHNESIDRFTFIKNR